MVPECHQTVMKSHVFGQKTRPKKSPGKARKQRRIKSEIVHMEHAGASSGELKNLIRAGRELIRRVEKRSREEKQKGRKKEAIDAQKTLPFLCSFHTVAENGDSNF